MVETALRCFEGTRYELRAWVIMSNHVHVLFQVGEVPMSEILNRIKCETVDIRHHLARHLANAPQVSYGDRSLRMAANSTVSTSGATLEAPGPVS